MAKTVQGTHTALQALRPLQADWSEASKIYNDRRDLEYDRKKKEEGERQKRRDAIDYSSVEPVVTGIDSLDKGIMLGVQSATDIAGKDFERALNDPAFAESAEYKMRKINLSNYSKNLKTFSDGWTKLAEKVTQMSQDGTLSAWDGDLLRSMNGVFKDNKTLFGVAKDGGVEAYIAPTDSELISEENPKGYVLDADGKTTIEKITPRDVFNGVGKFSITEEVDVTKMIEDRGKKLGKSITSKVGFFRTTSEQSWDTKKEETRNVVKGMLGDKNNLTPFAKRMWANIMGEKSRELSDTDMKKLEDRVLDEIKVYYDREVKNDVNFSAMESNAKRREDKEREAVTPRVVLDKETGRPKKMVIPNAKDKDGDPVKGWAVTFGSNTQLKISDTPSSQTFVSNIYYSEDGKVYGDRLIAKKGIGNPIYETDASGNPTDNVDILATTLQGKGWDEVAEKGVPLSDTELSNLATTRTLENKNKTNYKSSKEFIDEMKAQFDEASGKGKKGLTSKYNTN